MSYVQRRSFAGVFAKQVARNGGRTGRRKVCSTLFEFKSKSHLKVGVILRHIKF